MREASGDFHSTIPHFSVQLTVASPLIHKGEHKKDCKSLPVTGRLFVLLFKGNYMIYFRPYFRCDRKFDFMLFGLLVDFLALLFIVFFFFHISLELRVHVLFFRCTMTRKDHLYNFRYGYFFVGGEYRWLAASYLQERDTNLLSLKHCASSF